MKSIICELEKYDGIGFDLDGTLYDEFDFVNQTYQSVADTMSGYLQVSKTEIWNRLNIEWMKVGSSGSVFQNVFHYFGIQEIDKFTIKECVSAYRESPFTLTLPERAKLVLNYLKTEKKTLFLITDGDSNLQHKKIDSLGLEEWFPYIAVSGDYGREYQKPSTYMYSILKQDIPQNGHLLYCGDREVDMQFATSAGIDFIYIRNMCISQEIKS